MIPVFHGKVIKGALQADPRFDKYLATLEGQEVEVVVRKRKTQRSDPQNRAYWGIAVKLLGDHLGYDKDECHFALAVKFASHVDAETGLTIVEKTSKMSTVRFIKYYEDIQRWAAEFLGLDIPSPNECETYYENLL